MNFLEDISQTIVENTNKIIGYPISIMNDKGYIIGSTDLNRLGNYHEFSMDVLEKKDTIYYESDDVKPFKNVLPGVGTPIIINNKPIGVLGIIGEPAEVEKYAQLVKSHVELMCHEYLKIEMNVLESKTLNNFIHYLLNDINTEESGYIIRYGRMLGLNLELDIRRICFLIEIDMLSDSYFKQQNTLSENFAWQIHQDNLLNTVKNYLSDSKEDMISLLTLDQFIVIKTIRPDETFELFIKRMEHNMNEMMQYLKTKFDLTTYISIGSVDNGIEGIKRSYHDSFEALIAGKKTELSSKIYHYNDLDIMLEVVANSLPRYLSDRLTRSLDNFIKHDSYRALSSTFMTYCKCNMNLSETARTLFLHRNSLVYRLDKIKELTSLDTANFEHCLLLYFAIKNSRIESKPK
ncbi:CdaR family transcriptional regulator [Sporosarcina siberiensis]|uniref:CdaR family transcriptional regulator n=1 Tax=Sporosarcina siberiensis TaxID=1365606 RepID=A0ABW4SI08_9BACL